MPDSLPLPALIPSYRTSLKARNRSPRTIHLAETYSHRLARWLEESDHSVHVGEIDRRVLEEYFVHLATELSDTTVGIHYRTVRALFGWLLNEDEIETNPFAKMQQPTVKEQPVPVFSTDDLQRLLATTEGKGFEQRRDRAILYTLIDTGIRLGELVSMRVDELDDELWTAVVVGKTGPRVIGYGTEAAQVVDRYRRSRSAHSHSERPEFWISSKGALTRSGVAQLLKRRGRDAGVENVNPHRFRHTFAHTWLASGGQENDLVQLTGWRTNQMVARYGRSAAASRALAAKAKNSPGDAL